MGKLSIANKTDILPEFQTFLLEKKLSRENNVFFYALWANKYLAYARKKEISSDKYQESAIIEFIESLKSDSHISDWQLRQAQDALRLYYFHYLGLKPAALSVLKSTDDQACILEETKRMIRLKHYSFSTERTYLH